MESKDNGKQNRSKVEAEAKQDKKRKELQAEADIYNSKLQTLKPQVSGLDDIFECPGSDWQDPLQNQKLAKLMTNIEAIKNFKKDILSNTGKIMEKDRQIQRLNERIIKMNIAKKRLLQKIEQRNQRLKPLRKYSAFQSN